MLRGSAANIWAEFDFKLVEQLLHACLSAFNAKFCEIFQHKIMEDKNCTEASVLF